MEAGTDDDSGDFFKDAVRRLSDLFTAAGKRFIPAAISRSADLAKKTQKALEVQIALMTPEALIPDLDPQLQQAGNNFIKLEVLTPLPGYEETFAQIHRRIYEQAQKETARLRELHQKVHAEAAPVAAMLARDSLAAENVKAVYAALERHLILIAPLHAALTGEKVLLSASSEESKTQIKGATEKVKIRFFDAVRERLERQFSQYRENPGAMKEDPAAAVQNEINKPLREEMKPLSDLPQAQDDIRSLTAWIRDETKKLWPLYTGSLKDRYAAATSGFGKSSSEMAVPVQKTVSTVPLPDAATVLPPFPALPEGFAYEDLTVEKIRQLPPDRLKDAMGVLKAKNAEISGASQKLIQTVPADKDAMRCKVETQAGLTRELKELQARMEAMGKRLQAGRSEVRSRSIQAKLDKIEEASSKLDGLLEELYAMRVLTDAQVIMNRYYEDFSAGALAAREAAMEAQKSADSGKLAEIRKTFAILSEAVKKVRLLADPNQSWKTMIAGLDALPFPKDTQEDPAVLAFQKNGTGSLFSEALEDKEFIETLPGRRGQILKYLSAIEASVDSELHEIMNQFSPLQEKLNKQTPPEPRRLFPGAPQVSVISGTRTSAAPVSHRNGRGSTTARPLSVEQLGERVAASVTPFSPSANFPSEKPPQEPPAIVFTPSAEVPPFNLDSASPFLAAFVDTHLLGMPAANGMSPVDVQQVDAFFSNPSEVDAFLKERPFHGSLPAVEHHSAETELEIAAFQNGFISEIKQTYTVEGKHFTETVHYNDNGEERERRIDAGGHLIFHEKIENLQHGGHGEVLRYSGSILHGGLETEMLGTFQRTASEIIETKIIFTEHGAVEWKILFENIHGGQADMILFKARAGRASSRRSRGVSCGDRHHSPGGPACGRECLA
jgi:hypothetical protein